MHKFHNIWLILLLFVSMSGCGLLSNDEQDQPTQEENDVRLQDQASQHSPSNSSEQNNITTPENTEISKTQKNVTVTVKSVEKMNNNVRIHLRFDNYTQKDLHTGLTMSEVKQNADIYYPVKKDDLNFFKNPGDGVISAGTTTEEAFVTFTIADPNSPFVFKIDPSISHSMTDIESVGPFQFQF